LLRGEDEFRVKIEVGFRIHANTGKEFFIIDVEPPNHVPQETCFTPSIWRIFSFIREREGKDERDGICESPGLATKG